MRNVKKRKSKTIPIAICVCHGGFGLSESAIQYLIDHCGWTVAPVNGSLSNDEPDADIFDFGAKGWGGRYTINADRGSIEFRSHPDVIKAISEIGLKDAADRYCELKIVRVPADAKVHIEEYDGAEWVAEDHRKWD